ncbi:hypothetical protein [uncultured Sphingomonas sp.]|uniref:helix-turn-helix transcriptional regulator n=1 Tax=uncultured Sphingomonas sp. TaxID=158754 RepID=UPI0025D1BB91|nr:hypothetical protein [uncultured Sphingomonas sp.]
MDLSRVDQAELLTALYSIGDTAHFSAFLERLRRRTRADEAFVIEWSERNGWRSSRHGRAGQSLATALPLDASRALRAGRVYDLAEIGVRGAGKVIRSTGTLGDAWLGVRGDTPFEAADGALLVALSPHVAIASDNHARLAAMQRDLAAAQLALDRAGVGWTRLDRHGERQAGMSPPASPRQRAALADGIAAGAPIAAAGQMVALPFPDGGPDAALALFRTEVKAIDRVAAFAAAFGLTRAEARIGAAIATGTSIAEAANALGITEQTARYYTKRLFAATGTRGQPDLVRLFWTGIAALA